MDLRLPRSADRRGRGGEDQRRGQSLDFPGTVFGMPRSGLGEFIMPEAMARYSAWLGRHLDDRILDL